MSTRKIVRIDEEKCTGCGDCIPNCQEGALQVIDGKARLISDIFCDGLGACMGHCPVDAIKIEEREAEPYSEEKVREMIVKQGPNTIKAHLQHLLDHNETGYLLEAFDYLTKHKLPIPELDEDACSTCGGGSCSSGVCPGSAVQDFGSSFSTEASVQNVPSELTQWPVQLHLIPVQAPFWNQADVLIAADCTAYSYGNFHSDFLRGKKLIIACPKLDDTNLYLDKLTQFFQLNQIKSITILMMEVPCCSGLVSLVKEAMKRANKSIPLFHHTLSVKGEIL